MKLYNVIKIYENYTNQYVIEFNMDGKNQSFKCNSDAEFTYEYLVDVFIRKRYDNSKMQAIINNYLLENTNPEYIEEFNTMQEFRKTVKQFCKDILASVNK